MAHKLSHVLYTIADCEAWLCENDAEGTDAYDGSTTPAKRDLTPRERDILCRLLRDVRRRLKEESEQPSEWGFMDKQYAIDRVHITVMLDVLDPRREDEEDEA